MSHNVGNIDRTLRICAGLALIGASIAGAIGPWGYIGFVPLITGLVGRCPAYSLLGVRTCALKDASDRKESP